MSKNSRRQIKKSWFSTVSEDIAYWFFPFAACYAGTVAVFLFIGNFMLLEDEVLFNAIQNVDLNGLFLLTGAVIGSIGLKAQDKRPVGGALVSAFFLVFTSMAVRMVPSKVEFSGLEEPVQILIVATLMLSPAAMIGIVYFCMAALFQAKLDVTPDPTLKTADAPTVPAPSDLARDLRLSRSRARRSRVGR